MKRCYYCSIDVDETYKSCPNCEKEIKGDDEKFCLHCSKIVKKEARVCKYCEKTLPFNFYEEENKNYNEEVYDKNNVRYYPNFWQSILIVVSMIGTMILVGIIFEVLKEALEIKNILLYSLTLVTLTTILIFLVACLLAKVHKKNIFKKMFSKKIDFRFLYTIIPIVIGTMMINAFFNNLNISSQSNSYIEFMTKIASDKFYVTLFLIPIAFIAPITEELVYRGIILKGLSSHYSAKKAILISSTLFSIAHLNFAQIPNAFILGLVFSILMIHSRNISYVIIYHIINNFLVTFMLYFVDPEDLTNKSTTEQLPILPSFLLVILGVSFIYMGLKWTIKTITNKDTTVFPDENTHNKYLNSFLK